MAEQTLAVPRHVGIIMDGNGRWAEAQGLKRTDGHREGVEAIRRVAIKANELGIQIVTLYAFSTENWARPLTEVSFLMKLPGEFFKTFVPELIENNIRVRLTGFHDHVPSPTKKAIHKAIDATAHCTGMTLNFAFNYGGRAEIVAACQSIAEKVAEGDIKASEIDEKLFAKHLLTAPLIPNDNIDYMIRTSGEQRMSNFLLWQNAYSEFYFTDKFWPDFDGEALVEAIHEYQRRHRRYGKL